MKTAEKQPQNSTFGFRFKADQALRQSWKKLL